ncbi:hypothetical protein JCM3775_007322, partial [Rhodotorula graminis]
PRASRAVVANGAGKAATPARAAAAAATVAAATPAGGRRASMMPSLSQLGTTPARRTTRQSLAPAAVSASASRGPSASQPSHLVPADASDDDDEDSEGGSDSDSEAEGKGKGRAGKKGRASMSQPVAGRNGGATRKRNSQAALWR